MLSRMEILQTDAAKDLPIKCQSKQQQVSSAPPRGASERDALRGRVGLRAMDQELVRGRPACAQRAMAFHALWLAFRQRFTSASALTYAMRTSSSLSCTSKHEHSVLYILQKGVPCQILGAFLLGFCCCCLSGASHVFLFQAGH